MCACSTKGSVWTAGNERAGLRCNGKESLIRETDEPLARSKVSEVFVVVVRILK